MKKTLFLCSLAALMLAACGSNKKMNQNTTVSGSPFGETYQMPCEEMDSDTEFGATGIHKCSANQKGNAQMFALQNAQNIVRMKMQHAYRGMVSDFTQNYGGNAGNDIASKITMAGDQAINAIVNETRATCVRFSGVDARGDIECYVGIRISKKQLAKEVAGRVNDVLSEDEKMRTDFQEKTFRDSMEKRFKNFVDNNR